MFVLKVRDVLQALGKDRRHHPQFQQVESYHMEQRISLLTAE